MGFKGNWVIAGVRKLTSVERIDASDLSIVTCSQYVMMSRGTGDASPHSENDNSTSLVGLAL